MPIPPDPGNRRGYGTGIWRFDDEDAAALPEDVKGLGNFLNYGSRSILLLDGTSDVILGTANLMSIEQDRRWELRRFSPQP